MSDVCSVLHVYIYNLNYNFWYDASIFSFFLHILARSPNYRPRTAELIVPAGLSAASSTSTAAFNSTPNGKHQPLICL